MRQRYQAVDRHRPHARGVGAGANDRHGPYINPSGFEAPGAFIDPSGVGPNFEPGGYGPIVEPGGFIPPDALGPAIDPPGR